MLKYNRLFSDRRVLIICFVSFTLLWYLSSHSRPSYEWHPKEMLEHLTPHKDNAQPQKPPGPKPPTDNKPVNKPPTENKPVNKPMPPPPPPPPAPPALSFKTRKDRAVKLDYVEVVPEASEWVNYYWNIPFAASTYGNNRFRAPQAPEEIQKQLAWSGKEGKCPSTQPLDEKNRVRNGVDSERVPGIYSDVTEDCLFTHVFTPADAKKGDDLPVLVIIAGGGYMLTHRGNGGPVVAKSRVEKDGKVIDKGIIVVTTHYRHGIYGFLGGKSIEEHGDLNVGLKDQRASLEWVQKHIREFGGNPDHVVIEGNSAGGTSIMLQLTADGGNNTFDAGTKNKKLFHGAIAQSPAAPGFFTPQQSQHFYDTVSKGLRCGNADKKKELDCIRNATPGDFHFMNYPMPFPGRPYPPKWMWAPQQEPKGGMWEEPQTTAIMNGRYAQVPTIIGYTTNEGTDQTPPNINSENWMMSFIKDTYPALTKADEATVLKHYGQPKQWEGNTQPWWDPSARAMGDLRYICPTMLSSDAIADHNPSDVPTWQYESDLVFLFGTDRKTGYGTRHSSTINLFLMRGRSEFSDYLMSFIKHLDPNTERGPGTAQWDRLTGTQRKRLMLTNKNEKTETYMADPDPARAKRCADIKAMLPRLGQ